MSSKEFEGLLYVITFNTVAKIAEQNAWSEDTAMERFTESKLYTFLEDEKTKVWRYSATCLAELFNDEAAEDWFCRRYNGQNIRI